MDERKVEAVHAVCRLPFSQIFCNEDGKIHIGQMWHG